MKSYKCSFVTKYPNNGNGGKGTRMYIFCVLPPGEGRHFSAMLFMEKLLISTMWTTKQDWKCLDKIPTLFACDRMSFLVDSTSFKWAISKICQSPCVIKLINRNENRNFR